jgi:hypothetical protein
MGWLGLRGCGGALIRGARVWGAAAAKGSWRPGRGAWRHHGSAGGKVDDTGGVAVLLPCHGVGTGDARRRLVM